MNYRLQELRKEHLHMTLEKFAEPLGVQNSAISKLEKGRTNLTDQMILSICRTYNVNEEWLRTGNGPVFQELPEDDEFAVALSEITDDTFIKSMLIEYSKLDKSLRKAFCDFLIRTLERSKDNVLNGMNSAEHVEIETMAPKTKKSAVEEAEAEYIKNISISARKTESTALNTTGDIGKAIRNVRH